MLNDIEKLYELGAAIHWLRPKSKVPLESGWTTGPRKDWAYLKKTYRPGLNVGIRLGTPSKIGEGYLTVIDVDVKSNDEKHRKEAEGAALKLTKGIECPQVLSGRGGGSCHYYCLTKTPFKTVTPYRSKDIVKVHIPSKNPSKQETLSLTRQEIDKGIRLSHAWEISLYSDGRQVVIPPSIHPDSGRVYKWKRGFEEKLPLLSFDDLTKAETETSKTPKPTANLSTTSTEFKRIDLGWLDISLSIREGIETGGGNLGQDESTYLLKAIRALFSAGLEKDEILNVLSDPKNYLSGCAYRHAKTDDRLRAIQWLDKYNYQKIEKELVRAEKVFEGIALPDSIPEYKEEKVQDPNWRQKLLENKNGQIKGTSIRNLDLLLTNLGGEKLFIEDLFASRIEYGVNTPWGGRAGDYIQDIDMIRMKRWFADLQLSSEPSTGAILETTSLIADRCKIHPVREWLLSLKWDGKPRVNTWIKIYCDGKAEEPYLSEVSRKFLLAMVKRVFEPGCQWDYVLVLEGKQGRFKSSIARALASDKWFMDNLPDLKDKDAMLNLQGKWLIELGELADVKRTDYNLVKAYLVRRIDSVRPHYGRLKSDVPRQSVFIGTINEGQYLKDPTGNRRYWPVKVGFCDVKALKAVREQLFAEAMHIYKNSDEILVLGTEANEQATDAQEDRRVHDEISEMKEHFLEFSKSKEGELFLKGQFKIGELLDFNMPWFNWAKHKYVNQNGAQVLHGFGFKKSRTGHKRYWEKDK